VNPFAIPGAGSIPAPPLCPWGEGTTEHEDYYVAIDNAQHAFEEFTAVLDNSSDLPGVGWFVLVTGGEGCGKTSLINRCVHALREHLREQSITLTIAAARTAPAGTTDQRMETVCQTVLDLPEVSGLLAPDLVTWLEERCGNPARFYGRLSHALPADRALAVLLPSSELADEIRRYVDLCQGKIVFFAESPDEGVAADAPGLRSSQAQITTLHVTPLREGDGRFFSTARMTGHDGGGPDVDLEAAERMVAACLSGRGLPIGRLQGLLYEAYEEARARPDAGKVRITYEYLADYVVRSVLS
jgi:hypothetical protein